MPGNSNNSSVVQSSTSGNNTNITINDNSTTTTNTITVNINNPIIKVNKLKLVVSEEELLDYQIDSSEGYSDFQLSFASQDEKIAKVDKDGKVKGVSPGKTGIVIEDKNKGISAVAQVIVTTELNHSYWMTYRNKKDKLKLKGVKSKKVKWKSKNKRIAVVNKKGHVSFKAEGNVWIVAKYKGKKYKCEYDVIEL